MSNLTNLAQTSLNLGKSLTVLNESPTAGGSKVVSFAIESDTVLTSLAVISISGSLDINVYTLAGDDGIRDLLFSFPTITSSTNLILKKAAIAMGYIQIEAIWSGACEFIVKARAIATGDANARILGSSAFRATQDTVSTVSPSLVIPAAFTDRNGLVLKNNNTGSGILYIAESAIGAAIATAYPIYPQESLGVDLAAGAEIWAIAASSPIDVRILEAGG